MGGESCDILTCQIVLSRENEHWNFNFPLQCEQTVEVLVGACR